MQGNIVIFFVFVCIFNSVLEEKQFTLAVLLPLVNTPFVPQYRYLSQASQVRGHSHSTSLCVLSVDKIMISYMSRTWSESATEDTMHIVARNKYGWELLRTRRQFEMHKVRSQINDLYIIQFNLDLLCGKIRKECGA